MPVDGTRGPFGPDLPDLGAAEDVVLEGVELLHVFFEAPSDPVQAALPPALHPTIPGAVYGTFLRAPQSPWGPFALAEVRLSARLREKPRQLLLGSVCDNPRAAAALASAWGFRPLPGEVRLRRFYDCVQGAVLAGDDVVLEVSLADPEPIPGATLQYGPWANPAHVGGEALLVLTDPVVVFGDDRQRGVPRWGRFDAGFWSAPGVRPTVPIGASYSVVDVRLPPPSALADPGATAGSGLRPVDAA